MPGELPRLVCSIPLCLQGTWVECEEKTARRAAWGPWIYSFEIQGQIDFGFFLKMALILRTTVDMAVGTVAYSWQENYLEKVLMIQEAGSLPRALAGQREPFRTQCQ